MGEVSQYPAEALLEAVPDAIFLVDDEGEVTYASDRTRTLFGYEPEDVVGEPIEQLIPERLREDHVEYRQEYMDEPTRRPVGVGHELEARCADGGHAPVEVSLNPVEIDDRSHVVVAVRNVSERRNHQQQVSRLREATRQLLGAESTEAVARLVATAMTDLFGYESSVFRLSEGGRCLRPIAVVGEDTVGIGRRPSYPIDADTPVSRVYVTGEPERHDDVRGIDDEYDRGGARSAMYVPIGDHGVLAIVDRDVGAFDRSDLELASSLAMNAATILDRVHNEQELKRQIERLDEFAAVISHDLQNPLNVAQGRLEMAREEHGQEGLEEVSDALDRMEEIVESTLTLARYGDVVDETNPVAVGALAERCWDRVDAADADLVVVDDVTVYAGRDRLTHVFENLLYNAVDHGGTDVTVRIDSLDDEPGFSVEDDGSGIPDSERDRIFEAGYTNSADGTGFGLAIVDRIATAHGWQVRVTEGTQGGARFEFDGVEYA